MISRQLEVTLNLAVNEAMKWGHEYVTAEHVLSALLSDGGVKLVLVASGASIEQMQEDLSEFFSSKLENKVLQEGEVPQPTIGFQRVLQRAAQLVVSAGLDKIYGDTVLIALLDEKESFANYFLRKQNISRLDLINYISHSIVKETADLDELEVLEDELLKLEQSLGDADDSREIDDTRRNLSESQKFELNKNSQYPKDDAQHEGVSGEGHEGHEGKDAGKGSKKPNVLKAYTIDLIEKARCGKIDPLVGREEEIERTIHILSRRRKNNPLYVGDSGVGKTAIAEGLALKIFNDDVPSVLQGAKIYALDLGALLAGAKFRGDFEQRIKSLLKQFKKNPKAILFIDEIHTIIGAGSVGGGAMDASNLLKPALASGELRCMGSTTYKEFRQHFESDHAMARRFQRIDVEEPSVDDTIKILHGLKSQYEDFHGVRYSSEAIKAAVQLSFKHMRDKKLPDKAIDVIDEAGAFIALKKRSRRQGVDESKGDNILHKIGVADIKGIVAKIARIPEQRISSAAKDSLANLESRLQNVVFGQNVAVAAACTAIKMAKSGLANDDKPIGSFMFCGPTGVGKTELAKQLGLILGIDFLRFDMSECMERHAVARLIGAPPGYVGYEDGGLLTNAVNKKPHAVLLLDEIEKAHPDIHNILLQIMDHGTLTDSNGRETDFRNVILIMTTNVGAAELARGMIGFTRKVGGNEGQDLTALKKAFSPEFRNRLDATISFGALPQNVILKIVDKFLNEIEVKLSDKKIDFAVSDSAKSYLATTGYDPAYGARPLNRLIQDTIKKPIADELLFGALSPESIAKRRKMWRKKTGGNPSGVEAPAVNQDGAQGVRSAEHNNKVEERGRSDRGRESTQIKENRQSQQSKKGPFKVGVSIDLVDGNLNFSYTD